MASSSTRLCLAVCFCAVSFASGFFVACLASLRPSKKSSVQKKETPSSTITPPSSTTTPTKKYNVFISFRGKDTRYGFTSHLRAALIEKQIETFTDEGLKRGDKISPALLKSIRESMIAVVIFSKNFAYSKWCLCELVEIMECKKLHELIVIPVFYDVCPCDVRWQIGPFKDSFAKHKNESQEEVQKWREAFTEAANLSGWDSAERRSEAELVRLTVEDVNKKLMSKCISSPSDFGGRRPIGIDKRIAPVKSLCLDTKDVNVRIIGILGVVGVGKTTLAGIVFNQISCKFDRCCFMPTVRGRIEAFDRFEHEVVSSLLNDENLKLAAPIFLNPLIKERLNRKKILVVFDDVGTFSQLETLVEVLKRCSWGSRIIMISRDKQVLYNLMDDHEHIYEVDGLDRDEALALFREYAFKKQAPSKDLIELSEKILNHVEGNPRALKELGLSLQRRSKQDFESTLENLQGIGDSNIFNVLKKNYDGLNDAEKTYYLEIACFFHRS